MRRFVLLSLAAATLAPRPAPAAPFARVDATTLRAAAPPLTGSTPDGFPVPSPANRPPLPAAHGAHPAYRIEWWYITGHLFDDEGRRFGFQVTFFRSAAPPDPAAATTVTSATPSPGFGLDHIHLAHVALTDISTGRFIHQERLNRDGWDARAETGDLSVHNGDWSLRRASDDDLRARGIDPASRDPASGRGEHFLLSARIRGEAALDLHFAAAKPPVFFGSTGVSRKSADPTAASHYLTFTRLDVSGSLTRDDARRPVTGSAWFDHEISSSQLGDNQSGWDWASLQLDDGTEVMAYVLRGTDGEVDAFSTLATIDAAAQVRHIGPEAFAWEHLGSWTSPRTGATYPIQARLRFRISPDAAERSYTLVPLARDQELNGAVGGIPYWEGACDVLDASGNRVGRAYLELTGYAAPLGSRL